MKVGGFEQGLDDFTRRRHPGMELVPVHVTLGTTAPPCPWKLAPLPAPQTADGKRKQVRPHLCYALFKPV
ncbi:hypothetical protein GCM10025871_05430 [Deinococcus metallilatus]|nr:hypothetical protein GCM10025871_05430 [Deinococcus metallilatus]